MRQWFAKHITRDMIRPIIYKTTSRIMYMLTLALIWDRFINRSPVGLSTAFLLLFFGFLAAAWIAKLRMGGMHFPRLPAKKLRLKDRADIRFGDMIDHIDEPIINFDDLDTEEQDAVLIMADTICAVIFLIASFVV